MNFYCLSQIRRLSEFFPMHRPFLRDAYVASFSFATGNSWSPESSQGRKPIDQSERHCALCSILPGTDGRGSPFSLLSLRTKSDRRRKTDPLALPPFFMECRTGGRESMILDCRFTHISPPSTSFLHWMKYGMHCCFVFRGTALLLRVLVIATLSMNRLKCVKVSSQLSRKLPE